MHHNLDDIHILLISIHGLIRGTELELGRDADTGGQTKYVVELSRALAELSEVSTVYLLTRQIKDPTVSSDYTEPVEKLSDKCSIIRLPCGESEYIPKEQLWDTLDTFIDNTIQWLSKLEKLPDIIHSHYADAGLVGTRLAHHFGIPLVFTGHSLGRSKRKRLLASGLKKKDIEANYNINRRIEAEEETLGVADMVITSTLQEINEQYGDYDFYQPEVMKVVPPGTDLNSFFPPEHCEYNETIYDQIVRFFNDPDKPIILALSRPDPRKNIITLIEAYGESELLQEKANLVIIAGNRDDILDMDEGAQGVLNDILLTIDRYDLYGKVAYPKHHQASDVTLIYRIAALSHGVFINPALTEPFGLTIIEAAASGLPVVATEDGGPQDIIGNCQNGLLIDPLDKVDIQHKILAVLQSKEQWQQYSHNGIVGVREHYSWQAHANRYLQLIQPIIEETEPPARMCLSRRPMLYHDRAIVTDLDQNLLGDKKSLKELIQIIQAHRKSVSFVIATGRRLDSALSVMKKNGIPQPDVLITSVGTEIYYAPNLTKDIAWAEHIDYLWKPLLIRKIMNDLPGISLQAKSEQSKYKLSYYIDPQLAPDTNEINHLLLRHDQSVQVIQSFGQYLDIIPMRASKGMALRWVNEQWDIPLEKTLTAGGSGTDEDLLRGNTLAVVVANRHLEELSDLTEVERIYFANASFSKGIMEALDYYDFFNTCEVPDE
ncbi:MAG: HAD-IIB family hydrolase [Gammaproteobacteria bacterium]|nr:HAD-IIB family hydrolase [Gammaproteobacteria bacterium]